MNRKYFFDLDGTLLNSNSEIESSTLDLLKLYKIEPIICSGRPISDIKDILIKYNINFDSIIGLNGSHIVHNGIDFYKSFISESIKYELFSDIKSYFPDLRIEFKGFENRFYSSKRPIDFVQPKKDNAIIGDLDSLINNEIASIMIVSKCFKSHQNNIAKLKKKYEGIINVEQSHSNFIEFYSSNSSKGKAIELLTKDLQVETICFGDNQNDLSMFEICNYAFAVKNDLKNNYMVCNSIDEAIIQSQKIGENL